MKALAIATLAQIASAAACQRYAAVDMSPAGRALVPRFLIDAPQLAVRDGGICNPNYHSCVDIGYPETCCANSNYCYVRPDNQPWCCPVGSNCDSNCAATAYQCPTTVTRTVSETITGGAIITTSVSSACCGRTCPSTSAFRCESRFGGGCCSYGQTCVSGGGCVRAVTPTTSATALLTPIDPGCTATTQHACVDGGCCDRLWDCVVVSGTAACAPGRPTATDVRIVEDAPDELSTGAKAGIGVGDEDRGRRQRRRPGAAAGPERAALAVGFPAPAARDRGGARAPCRRSRPARARRCGAAGPGLLRPGCRGGAIHRDGDGAVRQGGGDLARKGEGRAAAGVLAERRRGAGGDGFGGRYGGGGGGGEGGAGELRAIRIRGGVALRGEVLPANAGHAGEHCRRLHDGQVTGFPRQRGKFSMNRK
ncbi:hypothetical protein CSUB01_06284 [Colletotrichum sublineola]|uniref:Uncharacterized protein n=1 Tax=Colletotrichum sublineola TaxID=1173701 RepID=A0A066XLP4_COLSU|nr:hypothetical protein CSUB01_06284 [Colletotrichum sublineola]